MPRPAAHPRAPAVRGKTLRHAGPAPVRGTCHPHAQCLSRGYNFASCMFLFGGGVTVAQQILVLLVLVRIQAPELAGTRYFHHPPPRFSSPIRSDTVLTIRTSIPRDQIENPIKSSSAGDNVCNEIDNEDQDRKAASRSESVRQPVAPLLL